MSVFSCPLDGGSLCFEKYFYLTVISSSERIFVTTIQVFSLVLFKYYYSLTELFYFNWAAAKAQQGSDKFQKRRKSNKLSLTSATIVDRCLSPYEVPFGLRFRE